MCIYVGHFAASFQKCKGYYGTCKQRHLFCCIDSETTCSPKTCKILEATHLLDYKWDLLMDHTTGACVQCGCGGVVTKIYHRLGHHNN